MSDNVPVGVIRQISKKPDVTRYEVLGLARVVSWNNGVFELQSTLLDDPSPLLPYSLHVAAPQEMPYGYDPTLAQDARQKVLREVVQRQGQKAFRSGLLTAYQGRCAITGREVEPVLEAAHITPYLGPQTNNITNGLLLRSDIHTLWDSGLIFLDVGFRISLKPAIVHSEYARYKGGFLLSHLVTIFGHPNSRLTFPRNFVFQQMV
jgi:putative restriction endonuclease